MKSPSQLPELSFCRLCHLSLDWVAMDFTGGVVPMENWRLRQWNEAFVGTAGILISDQFEMDFTKKLGQNRHLYLPWHTSPQKDLIWGICSQSGEVQRAIPSSNKVLQILGISETFWCLEFQFKNSKVFQPESEKKRILTEMKPEFRRKRRKRNVGLEVTFNHPSQKTAHRFSESSFN